MRTVGAMNTNMSNQNVTEISRVPADKYVYLLSSQSGNELSFVSSQPVMSRQSSELSPRLAGPHSSDHVVRSPRVGALSASLSWQTNTAQLEHPTY